MDASDEDRDSADDAVEQTTTTLKGSLKPGSSATYIPLPTASLVVTVTTSSDGYEYNRRIRIK